MSTILVVDDRADDRELLATLLGHAGHRVLCAADGEEALLVAREQRPDLVISDIVMQGINGYEFVRRLRGEAEIGATAVIFCTATYDEDEVRRLASSCGVSHLLSKPYEIETVLRIVGDVLGSRQAIPSPPPAPEEFDREQLRLLNDKLVQKVEELETSGEQRKLLVSQLIRAQEEERRRIAQDIHDDSIQAIAALGLRLDMLGRRLESPEDRELVASLGETVGIATARLRHLLFELGPPELESGGIASALRAYLDEMARYGGPPGELSHELADEPPEESRSLLYRTAQEALVNVRKHAGASRVEVTLRQRGEGYLLRVCDDGHGFATDDALNPRAGHLGLAALRDRVEGAGGTVTLDSSPGEGTTVEAWLPQAVRAGA